MIEARFPLLPIGTEVHGFKSGRLLSDHGDFQILEVDRDTVLLVAPVQGAWPDLETNAEIISDLENQNRIEYWDSGRGRIFCLHAMKDERPVVVGDLPRSAWPIDGKDLAAIVEALAELAERSPGAAWGRALYVPDDGSCLDRGPGAGETPADRRHFLTRIMTGGLVTDRLERISEVNGALTPAEIVHAFEALGLLSGFPPLGRRTADMVGLPPFFLPGRHALATAFEEHVIDYWRRPDHYHALGYRPPGGILISGPPGTGKSYAASRLADHLGWAQQSVDLGTIGSAYIHETSQRLQRIFEKAVREAPSLIIMNEVDALALRRDGAHDHKIEELSQLLLLIEKAAAQRILVIGTTNRPEAIDPAFLRPGRFDLKLEAAPPSVEEVDEVLSHLFAARPLAAGASLAPFAVRLAARPMSDLDWFANEASRLAARSEKTSIDDLILAAALRSLATR